MVSLKARITVYGVTPVQVGSSVVLQSGTELTHFSDSLSLMLTLMFSGIWLVVGRVVHTVFRRLSSLHNFRNQPTCDSVTLQEAGVFSGTAVRTQILWQTNFYWVSLELIPVHCEFWMAQWRPSEQWCCVHVAESEWLPTPLHGTV